MCVCGGGGSGSTDWRRVMMSHLAAPWEACQQQAAVKNTVCMHMYASV